MYIAQLVRYLHSMHQVLDSISSPCSSNMVVDACKPSIWEMEAGGSEILLPSIFFLICMVNYCRPYSPYYSVSGRIEFCFLTS